MQLELGGASSERTWTGLSDAEFLKAVAWKRGMASDLVQAAKAGNIPVFIAALANAWQPDQESDTVTPPQPCRALWSLRAIPVTPRELELATAVTTAVPAKPKRAPAKMSRRAPTIDPLENWWVQRQAKPTPLTLWEYLVLLEMLPRRITRLTIPAAFTIWRELLTLAVDINQLAQMGDLAPSPGAAADEVARYGYQADPILDLSLVRQCELPWLAGVVFSAVKGSEKLRHAGAELLEHELVERTDDHGAPHAELLPRLPFWLAVPTRILLTAATEDITVWDADAADLYRSLIEKVAPLIQPDGQFALSHVQVADSRRFAEEVLRASGWSEADAAIRSLFVASRRGAKSTGSTKIAALPQTAVPRRAPLEICIAPVNQSDDAGWAVLRTHWGAHADRATVVHDQPAMNVELTVQGRSVLAGEWYSEITIADRTTPFRGEWYCVCWQTDEDADYIELQLFIRGVVRVERQILLSRTRQFCLIAESLGDIKAEQFQYQTRLPLVDGVRGTTAATTREVQLDAGGGPIRVFPIKLPDRHVFSTPGQFGADFRFQTTASGSAWYNPILIDWSPSRRNSDAVWKSLTVAEQQKVVQPDFAAGHRIKVGNHQWLIYRSLRQSIEPRSVLGHQTRYETVIGAVENNGDITPLMLVE